MSEKGILRETRIPGGFDKRERYRIDGEDTLLQPEDIKQAIPDDEWAYLDGDVEEADAYWLTEEFSAAIILKNRRHNEFQYYVIEPYVSEAEQELIDFLHDKLEREIEIESIPLDIDQDGFESIIQDELFRLLKRFSLVERGFFDEGYVYYADRHDGDGEDDEPGTVMGRFINWGSRRLYKKQVNGSEENGEEADGDDIETADTPEDFETTINFEEVGDAITELAPLSRRQVDKILYYLIRDYTGYGRITPLLNDENIEDISAVGYNQFCYAYHTDLGHLRTNIYFEDDDLDSAVRNMAEKDGKGISKRQPTVDATLDEGERVQLTLANEVSEKGSNFTIRLFRDVPFTPIDLLNWHTMDLDMMTYLWLCVEYGKKIIFAGGTGAGKTTTLNSSSLFLPESTKIVSIEDTPELTLPQENWIQETTRTHEREGGLQNYSEYDLLETALRQRPEYILMGEVRSQDAATTLFQAIDSGHITFTTFHGDTVEGIVNRFTEPPLNISEPQFANIDLILLQSEVRVGGQNVRRVKQLAEIERYDKDTGEVVWNEAYNWDPRTDSFEVGERNLLEEIRIENGWTEDELEEEMRRRKVVLAYCIRNGIIKYAEVAGVLQGYGRSADAIMHLIAEGTLEDYLDNLKQIESLDVDVDPQKEERLNRPRSEIMAQQANDVLEENADLIERKKDLDLGDLFSSVADADLIETPDSDPIQDARDSIIGGDEGDAGEETAADDDEVDDVYDMPTDIAAEANGGAAASAGDTTTDNAEPSPPVGETDEPAAESDDSDEDTVDDAPEKDVGGPDEEESEETDDADDEDADANDSSGGIIGRIFGGGDSGDGADSDAEEDAESDVEDESPDVEESSDADQADESDEADDVEPAPPIGGGADDDAAASDSAGETPDPTTTAIDTETAGAQSTQDTGGAATEGQDAGQAEGLGETAVDEEPDVDPFETVDDPFADSGESTESDADEDGDDGPAPPIGGSGSDESASGVDESGRGDAGPAPPIGGSTSDESPEPSDEPEEEDTATDADDSPPEPPTAEAEPADADESGLEPPVGDSADSGGEPAAPTESVTDEAADVEVDDAGEEDDPDDDDDGEVVDHLSAAAESSQTDTEPATETATETPDEPEETPPADDEADATADMDDSAAKVREQLLEQPNVGETEDDVLLDPNDCFEIIYDEDLDIYRQCQNQLADDDQFCHKHSEIQFDGGQPMGG